MNVKRLTEINVRSGDGRRQNVAAVRACGTIALIVGGALSVMALVFSRGEPPFQIVSVSIAAAVIGLGMRLEAALRERR
ncbi:hypothetical protein [Nonomuraea cavernae]|uniref:hypothetical protein n=1 Tax=Nonomuraea cavernae TaxID=2045107 RepID=UPI0033FE59D0